MNPATASHDAQAGEPQFSIGIDLGTTHCALAYVDIGASDGEKTSYGVLEIPQLTAPGSVGKLPLLRTGLSLITAIYLVRGAAVLPLMAYVPGRSETFWWWSSAICLAIGLIHLIGLRQVWGRLSIAAA